MSDSGTATVERPVQSEQAKLAAAVIEVQRRAQTLEALMHRWHLV